jgi:hypothetical protein
MGTLNLPADRIPVDVNVQRSHEHRHLDPPVIEKVILVNFFYHDNRPVCRTQDVIVIQVHIPGGVPEKTDHEKEKDETDAV